ncbi:MAG: type II toxin-antitoxin system RelE/ParE family toxin [Luteolibacter sp.]
MGSGESRAWKVKMEVIYHRLVVRDLRVALNYYELEGGTKLADRFFAEVEGGILAISARPAGQHFSDGGYRRMALRSFPYHILYDVDSLGIWIGILRHDRRHPSYGLRRKRRN